MPTRKELRAEAISRGLIQAPQPTHNDLLKEAQRRGLEIPEKSMWEKTKDLYNGNAEFEDAGSFESWQWTQPNFGLNAGNLKTTMAGMFGNDQDKFESFKANNPNINIILDKNKNPYFEDKGKKYYLDMPGLDAGDIVDFGGEASTYAAGGALTAPIKGLGKRILATGGVESGINAINQKMAGRDEINKTEMALAGGGGAAFSALTPLISNIYGKIKGVFSNTDDIGEKIARELDLSLSPEQTKKLGKYAATLDKKIDKKHLASTVELNQTPTLGTLSKNQDILDTEQLLRNAGSKGTQDKLRLIDKNNEQGMQKAFNDFQANVSGGQAQSLSAIDAGAKIQQGLLNAEKSASQKVDDAYKSVGKANVGTNTIKSLPDNIKKAFSENNIILDPDNIKKTNIALSDLTKSIDKIKNVKGVSFKAIDQQRKRLNSMFNGAKPEDKRALTIMMKEYDNAVKESFEQELLSSSDGNTLNNLLSARKEASKYFNTYQKKGSVVSKWLDDELPPEQIVNGLININGIAPLKAPQKAKDLIKALGKGTDQHNLIKEMFIQRLVENTAGKKSNEALRTALQKSIKGQPTLMNQIFNKKEMGFLSRAMHFMENTTPKGNYAKSSGTTERLARWAGKSASSDVSLSNMLNLIKKGVGFVTRSGDNRLQGLPYQQLDLTKGANLSAQAGANYSSQ